MADQLFDEMQEQSLVKSTIVEKYFDAWSRVIVPWAKTRADKLAYIDLFCGPGRYGDGAASTPLLVLERAIADEDLRRMLVTVFNDRDEENVQKLRAEIANLADVTKLKHAPQIHHGEVDEEMAKALEKTSLVPTLFFVDPWGYKGLSLRLVNSVLQDWGCDCIFFFNYNRINMGIRNPLVRDHMAALFGNTRTEALIEAVEGLGAAERELCVIEELCQALKDMGGTFVLPFRFKSPQHGRTSHHLIFVSKHVRGYEIMKEIMARESSTQVQGVPSFEYNAAAAAQGVLLELAQPLDDLADLLVQQFHGRSLSMKEVYEQHHVGTHFIKSNYKSVLGELENAGRLVAAPPASRRQKRNGKIAFADRVQVEFPNE